MAYTKTIWVNDNEPDIDADNLNKMEQGIYDGQLNAEWGHITGSLENQPEIPSIGGEAENNISFIHTPNNYYDSVEKIENKKLNSTGTALEDAEGFNTTDFIKVVSGNKYEFDAEGLTEGDIVWEYNANKEPITSTSLTTHNQVIIMTANTKYVRLSVGTYYYMVDTPLIQNKIVVDNEKFTDTINIGTEVDDKSRINLLHSKNLLPNGINSQTINGLTITRNNNGTLQINGTANALTELVIGYIDFKANTNYFVSGCPSGGGANKYFISVRGLANDYGEGLLINRPSNENKEIFIRVYSGQTLNNAIFSPMINEGSTALPYTPFVQNQILVDSEKYSDTLNISSEVDNTKGLNVLYSSNLFDKKIGDIQNGLWYDASNNKITSNNGGWYVVIPIESNKSYTISRKNINNNNGLHLAVGTTASTPTANASFVSFGDDYGANVKLVHINSGSTAKYMIIYVMGVAQNLMTDTLKTLSLEEMQVEAGTIQTPYTPYITPSLVVNNETIYQQPVVLWTNPSPTSDFASGDITLNDNLSNYSYYEILFLFSKTENYELTTGKIETNRLAFLGTLSSSGGNIAGYRRLVSAITNNKITFSGASIITATGTTGSNTICIPYKILGYK